MISATHEPRRWTWRYFAHFAWPAALNRCSRLPPLVFCLFCIHCSAADYSLSGFGTLGYARSDQPFKYQRFIDNTGTLRRDSVAGLQLDARLTDQIGATVQVKAAPDTNNDARYEASVSWAFASWRPTDDLLLRAGKQRLPLYLHSQNYDVGVTYDFARLPTEMYSISPSNDFTGISASKSWTFQTSEIVLDAYAGRAEADARYWFRDEIPNLIQSGASFRKISLSGTGFNLTFKRSESLFKVGVLRATGRQADGTALPANFPFVSISPGIGYFKVDATMPGPPISVVDHITNTVLTLAAEIDIGYGWRASGELARTFVSDPAVIIANASTRGYIALSKRIAEWSPYVSFSFLRSDAKTLKLYERLNGNSVPPFVPGAAVLTATQRAGADGLLAYDERSLSVGSSYSFSAKSKLKAELMHVKVGRVSSLVDAPTLSNIRNQHINVLSVSYSFVF